MVVFGSKRLFQPVVCVSTNLSMTGSDLKPTVTSKVKMNSNPMANYNNPTASGSPLRWWFKIRKSSQDYSSINRGIGKNIWVKLLRLYCNTSFHTGQYDP